MPSRCVVLLEYLLPTPQVFQLMREGAEEYEWKFDFVTIAAIWLCVFITARRFLQNITEAYRREVRRVNCCSIAYFQRADPKGPGELAQGSLRLAGAKWCRSAAFLSASAYYDAIVSERLRPNFFIASPTGRIIRRSHFESDRSPRGNFFH